MVELYQHRFDISEDQIRESLATNFNDASWMTKDLNTGNVFTPSSEMKIISVKLQSIDLNTYASKEEYISALNQTLYFEKDRISSIEYNFLRTSIYITSRLMDLVINNNVRARGWWSDWGKCTSGILGGVLGGGLTGAGIGSVVPGLGTAIGSVIGGGLSGAATAC